MAVYVTQLLDIRESRWVNHDCPALVAAFQVCQDRVRRAAVWELHAEDLAALLLPRALALADADGYEFYMTSTELTVARLSALLGRFDQAVDYFGRACATLKQRGQPVVRAIVDYDEALARLSHGQPGAPELLAVASARFHELGMREWSRRAALLEVANP